MVAPNRLKRPHLVAIPLASVWPPPHVTRPGTHNVYITMRRDQWDALLAAAYAQGFILIEVNHRERPVRAYRKPSKATTPARIAIGPDTRPMSAAATPRLLHAATTGPA